MKSDWFKSSVVLSALIRFALSVATLSMAQWAFAADPLNGQSLYKNTTLGGGLACSSCHGATPNTNNQLIWNASGTTLNQGVPSAISKGISANAGGMGVFSAVSAADLADMAAYINAVRYGKPIVAPATACTAQTITWTVGNNTCNASAAATASGASAALSDTIAPTTGTASAACANGVWGAATNATCTSPSACASGDLSWTSGANTCNATAPATASGATAALSDTLAPTTGAASFTCSNGTWGAATNVSCTAPIACSAAALSWTVGANTCDGAAAATASGASATLTDAAAPTTGAATFACNNGAWGPATATTCNAPVGCAASPLSWTVGANTCNATSAATASGFSAVLSDTTAPTTGAATFSCSNGAWGAATSTTCAVPVAAAPCSGALSWTVGTNVCNATAASTASGATAALSDTTAPTTGAASFSCSNGVWGAPTNVSCTAPVACNATALSWTVGGNTCDAAATTTADGASATLTDAGAPTTGAATFSCSNGLWGAATGATCSAPVGCSAGAVSWKVGTNTCDGTAAATSSGAAALVSDTSAPTTGAASFSCSNGVWGTPTNASCNAPAGCNAGVLSWSVGGNSCSGAVVQTTSGLTASLQNTSAPNTGAATYACTNGTWSAVSSTCNAPAPVACAAQAVSWTVGANTCNATAASTASGSSFSLSDSTGPTTGTAAVSCTNGVWAAPTGGTCNAATGPRGVSSLNGESLWTTLSPVSCAGCHGAKPDADLKKIWNASGTSAANDKGNPASIRSGINNPATGMGMYSAASDADLADIAAYINAVRHGKPLTDGAGVAAVKPYILLQNGKVVPDSVLMPTIQFGSASSVKTTLALQAPAGAVLHIEKMAIDNPLFTLNRVPVAAADRQLIAATAAPSAAGGTPTQTATVIVQGMDQSCPTTAFDLQAGAACGVEVVMAVNNPGVVSAKLLVTTDPAIAPTSTKIEATVEAQATGGAGGGGCTMRSAPGLFDPMLLLLSVLSLGVLALRRSKASKQKSKT
jgi:cytochrome c553